MIKLEVIDDSYQHFCIRADQPARIEISVLNGRAVVFVYEGVDDDLDQESIGCYDGNEVNTDWEVY